MRVSFLKCIHLETGVMLLLSFAFSLPAFSFDQSTAMTTTAEVQRQGSDESMQHSEMNAMTAVMNLATLNVPGAISHGYKAYGQYRNSKDLDSTADYNDANSANLSSGAGSSSKAASGPTSTTFSRLNTDYQRKGEYDRVASEFEQRSGMSREAFHKFMGQATDNPLSMRDPQLLDKLVGRFEGFAAQIPNAEFRKNIERGINLVPQSARDGILAKALHLATNAFARSEVGASTPEVAVPAPTVATKPAETVAANTPADNSDMFPGDKGASVSGEAKPGSPLYKLSSVDRQPSSALWNVMEDALASGRGDSIFAQISKRYQVLAPKLVENLRK